MSTKIARFYRKLSDQELFGCIKDIKKLHQTGVLPNNSIVTKVKEDFCNISGMGEAVAFDANIKNLRWEAAQRWFDQVLDRV
jgi:hypothetical protein